MIKVLIILIAIILTIPIFAMCKVAGDSDKQYEELVQKHFSLNGGEVSG